MYTATLTYPRATLLRTDPQRWSTPDGYTIVKTDRFHVLTPTGEDRAVCALMREAREAIEALRETGNQYAHAWIAFPRSN